MRTTIDLPEDLHRTARAIAHDKGWTLSQAVIWLMKRGLQEGSPPADIRFDPITGWPTISVGKVITSEDVAAMEDEW